MLLYGVDTNLLPSVEPVKTPKDRQKQKHRKNSMAHNATLSSLVMQTENCFKDSNLLCLSFLSLTILNVECNSNSSTRRTEATLHLSNEQ